MKTLIPEATEHQIQNTIIHYLKMNGYFVIRMNSGAVQVTNKYGNKHMMRLSDAGTPDLYALKDGQSYFLEVKRNKKSKVTALQSLKMCEIEDHGGVCYVVTSIDDLKEYGL